MYFKYELNLSQKRKKKQQQPKQKRNKKSVLVWSLPHWVTMVNTANLNEIGRLRKPLLAKVQKRGEVGLGGVFLKRFRQLSDAKTNK